MKQVTFSYGELHGDRVYYIGEDDVKVVLSRLPENTWHRLRTVHFNDHSGGIRRAGYVTRGRREITICARPPRIRSLTKVARRQGVCPEYYGAIAGKPWPKLAVRRFLLYDVFLHELGHLQIVNEKTTSRLRFAREKVAQEFADSWRRQLWSRVFDHPDPVHNPPEPCELAVEREPG